jgi:L-asparaginase
MLENLAKPVFYRFSIANWRSAYWCKRKFNHGHQTSLRNENGPVISEVGLYFEYKLYRGNRTTKINAEHFTSPNYPQLVESGVHLKWSADLLPKSATSEIIVHKNLDTNVIKMFLGMCSRRFWIFQI